MISGASCWIKTLTRSHLCIAVMNADVDRFSRLLWKCMEMSLCATFLYSVFDVWFHKKRLRSCFIAAGTQKERERGKEYLWQSLSWLAEHSVTYLMSIMHLCHLLCVLRRETHNIIHNACIMVGHKNPLIQGERSDIQLRRKLTGLNLSLNTSLLEVVDHVNSSISNSH